MNLTWRGKQGWEDFLDFDSAFKLTSLPPTGKDAPIVKI